MYFLLVIDNIVSFPKKPMTDYVKNLRYANRVLLKNSIMHQPWFWTTPLSKTENLTYLEHSFHFFFSKLKNNPIKCTCELMRQLSDTAVRSKIADLSQIQCTNLNKTVEEAMRDVNCGMIVFSI